MELANIDWSQTDHLGAVKNQGYCGSCWAFSSTSVLESLVSIKATEATGSLVSPIRLSEQQGIDCSMRQPYGNFGCDGGNQYLYWWFTWDNGAMSSLDYPYSAHHYGGCKQTTESTVAARAGTIVDVDKTSVAGIHSELQNGPLSVTVNGSSTGWHFYSGGVIEAGTSICTSSWSSLDHAVTLVGYDSGIETITTTTTTPATSTQTCTRASRTESKAKRCYGSGEIYDRDNKECCVMAETEGSTTTKTETVRVRPASWKIMNSWGADWGENGFIRLEAVDGGEGVCGLNQYILGVLPYFD